MERLKIQDTKYLTVTNNVFVEQEKEEAHRGVLHPGLLGWLSVTWPL